MSEGGDAKGPLIESLSLSIVIVPRLRTAVCEIAKSFIIMSSTIRMSSSLFAVRRCMLGKQRAMVPQVSLPRAKARHTLISVVVANACPTHVALQ